ncbi:MAG: hypothetical protein JWQ32_2821 [Marmoricola sp.]|nr:hypothetical protein [Marmoricola sp.]
MTDQTPPPPSTPDPYAAPPAPAYGAPAPVAYGPVGKVRSTGLCILLAIVTIGIYELVWFFKVHDEMKNRTSRGLGGGIALLIAFFIAPVMLFLTPAEVGNLQEAAGQPRTVSGLTGLWILLPLIGPIVWFVKTNGALNRYWESQGATA